MRELQSGGWKEEGSRKRVLVDSRGTAADWRLRVRVSISQKSDYLVVGFAFHTHVHSVCVCVLTILPLCKDWNK